MQIQNNGTYWTIALSKAESIINISSSDIFELKKLFMDRMSKKFDNAVIDKFKRTSTYPYQITINEENKNKLPVVPDETMREADEMFGDIVDEIFGKKVNSIKLPKSPNPVIIHETFTKSKVKK